MTKLLKYLSFLLLLKRFSCRGAALEDVYNTAGIVYCYTLITAGYPLGKTTGYAA